MTTGQMRDLVILAADKDMEQMLERLVQRRQSLATRPIDYVIYVHPRHDNGCRTGSLQILRPLTQQFRHALVLFDHEGSGAERQSADEVEMQVRAELESNGWHGRARVIAIDPELEIWMWSDSPEVDQVIGWAGRQPPVRSWLASQGFELHQNGKPVRPKEALVRALREVRKQPSPALFAKIASSVSLSRCTDRSFVKLREILQSWFGDPADSGLS